jgi:uncharacterized membrane protein
MTGKSKHKIHPRYFAAALILSPLSTILLGLVFFFIPIVPLVAVTAVMVGGPAFFIIAGPALYYWLRAGHHKPLSAAWLGLRVNVTVCVLSSAVVILNVGTQDAHILLGFLGISSIFAMVWCAGFAGLYRRFTRRSPKPDTHGQPQ